MALPDFICIGAQKAGTTWLYEMLAENPAIWLPPLKEVHYFDHRIKAGVDDPEQGKHIDGLLKRLNRKSKTSGAGRGSPGEGKAEFLKSLSQGSLLTEEWYRRIFSHPEAMARVSGEITPSYLILDEDDIAYVKSLVPDARIVLILRDPVSRALSQLRMIIDRSKTVPTNDSDWTAHSRVVKKQRRGDYMNAIPLWQKYFSPEQFLVVPFGDIKTRPEDLIKTIEAFLGVPHYTGYASLTEPVHQSKKLEIPAWVIEDFEQRMLPQQDYIKTTFGADFFRRCR